MIQRIQSLWLGLVAIIHILIFFIPVFSWNRSTNVATISDSTTAVWNLNALYNTPFIIVNVLIILFSIFIIVQYKNRKKQRSYVFILSVIIILNVCLYVFYMIRFTTMNEYTFVPAKSYGMFGQLLSLICCFLAAHRIKKDDDLVKSIDRIR